MKILLSNDDGYDAPGLMALHEEFSSIADVVVVAPNRDCSGFSNALTLRKPIRVQHHGGEVYSIDGTPADCVHLAITGMFDCKPDLVISGINRGENVGDDPIYSGTIAAAREGRFLPLPAIAISQQNDWQNSDQSNDTEHLETAVRIARNLFNFVVEQKWSDYLLNVNVPNLRFDEILGVEITRCGNRGQSEPVIKINEEGDDALYQIGKPGQPADNGPGTDFHALKHNKVSITPLTMDMTDHSKLSFVKETLSGIAD